MARLGHSTTAAAIRYQRAAESRDRELAQRLDALVVSLSDRSRRGPAGWTRDEIDDLMRPGRGTGPDQGLFQQPQRDSNPCRHLERRTRAVRPVLPRVVLSVMSLFTVLAGFGSCCQVLRRSTDGDWQIDWQDSRALPPHLHTFSRRGRQSRLACEAQTRDRSRRTARTPPAGPRRPSLHAGCTVRRAIA
jgi:hypothetical protein